MNLWRLEWVRLLRSRRLFALLGIYVFLGATGPFVARYLSDIVERFGSDVEVSLPEAIPADGISQFTANANQLGLLVAVVVAAGALVIDAIPEMSAFLRTRVSDMRSLVAPRLAASFAAIAAAFLVGLAFAWYETVVLLGSLPAGAVLGGAVFTIVYLAFVVSLTAAVASRTGAVPATVAAVVIILLVLPILGIAEVVGRWLPSHLLGALDALIRETEPWVEFLPATALALIGTLVLVWLTIRWTASREL